MAKLLHRVVGEDVILTIDLFPGSAPVMIDPRSNAEQLLMNLAVNARDAMPSGGSLRHSHRNRKRQRCA